VIGWGISFGVGVVGLFVLRAWRKDAAIRSGEVMDVRDLLPDGQGDCLVRVLGERLYRVEIQVEATIANEEAMSLPCRLVLTRSSDHGDEVPVWEGTRRLVELLPLAAGSRPQPGGPRQVWGSFPLLEFTPEAITRLRFEVEIPVAEAAEGQPIARLDKANLVVKENVRPLVLPARWIERIAIRPL
jgi:hypothetical protein